MGFESSRIMSSRVQDATASTAVVQTQGTGGEEAAGRTSPAARPRLWSWSTLGQRLVLRDSASAKIAPCPEGEVELQDVEIGTAALAKSDPETHRVESIDGITVKPQGKKTLGGEEPASCFGRALIMYSGRLPSDPNTHRDCKKKTPDVSPTTSVSFLHAF